MSSKNNQPERRYDQIFGCWVIFSPSRQKRPEQFDQTGLRRGENGKGNCPFCRGNEEMTPGMIAEYKGAQSQLWDVRVFENKYPFVFGPGGKITGEGMFLEARAGGSAEVIATAYHRQATGEQPVWMVELMLRAYQDRIRDLTKRKEIEWVQIFQNEGDEAAASIVHPHSQLVALDYLPKDIIDTCERAIGYGEAFPDCLVCDLVKAEIEAKKRIVIESENFIVISPYASRFPFQMRLLPKEHQYSLEMVDKKRRQELAGILKKALFKLDQGLGDPAYNFLLYTSPVNGKYKDLECFHWFIDIFPRLTLWGGLELAAGAVVNEVLPELAAEFLREVE